MATQVLPSGASGSGGGTPASTVVTTNAFGQQSAVGTSTDYARADHVHGSPTAPVVIQSDGWFGSGIDGDLTVTGTTTLTRNTFYNNLTITATGTLKPAGFRFYVAGTLTIAAGGSINDDGNPGSGATGGSALALRGSLGAASAAGGNGSTGGTNGGAGAAVTNVSVNSSFALPNGGTGGSGGGNTGGTVPACSVYNAAVSLNDVWPCITIGHVFARGSSSNLFNGGGGGSGGGAGATSTAGGGGAGAGGVWVACKVINNAGRISADGGAGGNATAGNAGGGGGGGGGYAIVMYQSTTGSGLGTVQANGGAGGAGFGTGSAGGAGSAGIVRTLKMG